MSVAPRQNAAWRLVETMDGLLVVEPPRRRGDGTILEIDSVLVKELTTLHLVVHSWDSSFLAADLQRKRERKRTIVGPVEVGGESKVGDGDMTMVVEQEVVGLDAG